MTTFEPDTPAELQFYEQEKVHLLQKRGGKIRRVEAVVLKVNKIRIRIKAKTNGEAWQFTSVRPEELEKVAE